VWLMQPKAQTATRGSLAVSACALEIAIVIQGALKVFWLYLFTINNSINYILQDPFIITNETGYEPFELGLEKDIFIKWPNRTVMPESDYNVTNSTAMLGFVCISLLIFWF